MTIMLHLCINYIIPFFQSGLKTILSEESGLQVRLYYLECMAQATYLISHEDSAFIVDPRRDVDAFIDVSLEYS